MRVYSYSIAFANKRREVSGPLSCWCYDRLPLGQGLAFYFTARVTFDRLFTVQHLYDGGVLDSSCREVYASRPNPPQGEGR